MMRGDFDLTGNDYVSIPFIGLDGAMDGINVLHAGAAGLIEWSGSETVPLLRLEIRVDDVVIDLQAARWRRLDRWIPTFTATLDDGSELSGAICAPTGYPPARGFLIRVELDNRGRRARQLHARLHVHWSETRLRIATARRYGAHNHVLHVDGAIALATADGAGPALAIDGSSDLEIGLQDAALANGTPHVGSVGMTTSAGAGRRTSLSFFVGAGREADGARAAASTLRRAGADHWLRHARLELSHVLRAAQDHRWGELLNRNLLFNRYYACGRSIDDDRLHLLRSRSPFCPAPALFNEREALLWTLPALVLADAGVAREALFRVMELHSERSGEHTRYLDGGAFDPAFTLAQFMLYAWAIEHYRTAAADDSVLDEPLVQQVIAETDSAAFMRLHPEHMLAASEVLPSGDAADYPYATLPNAMLHWFSQGADRLLPPLENGERARFDGAASEIAAAIWQFCVTDVGGEMVFVSSANLEGEAAVYDDPLMSLALLPFFEFCSVDDPVWRGTMEFLRSPRYPLWRDGAVPGLATRSDPAHARLAALCSDLLGPYAREALDRLLDIALPQGVAAAAWDPQTGAATMPHDAALAGFLAWTLVRSAEPQQQDNRRRRRRA